MTGTKHSTLIKAYVEKRAKPKMYFSSFFQSPEENFYNTETVELDIQRRHKKIAIAVNDMSSPHNLNTSDNFTNKEFLPPVYKEALSVNAFQLMARHPGEKPFNNLDYRANLVKIILREIGNVEDKLRRSIELQASQIFQTGTLDLKDSNGNTKYGIDFKPKTDQFPNAQQTWEDAASDPLNDIQITAEEIKRNSGVQCNRLDFGEKAWINFRKNDLVRKQLDTRRDNSGSFKTSEEKDMGQTHHGYITIGSYNYELYTYNADYVDPQSGETVKFLDDDKVVLRYDQARLDLTFGNIPNLGAIMGQPALLPELPTRMSNIAGGLDLVPSHWLSENKESLFFGVSMRPMCIPTEIDSFGCITTKV